MKYCLHLNRLLILVFAFVIGACGGDDGGSGNSGAPEIEMVSISAGAFMMGSPVSEFERTYYETQHSVTLNNAFCMSKHEITQKEWYAVMKTKPSYFTGDDLPVERVTWFDAIEFCNNLSKMAGLDFVYTISGIIRGSHGRIIDAAVTMDLSKNGYRLPTEAEWEYACRGDYPNKATETATKPFGIGDGTKMELGLANFYVRYSYGNSGEYDVGNDTGYVDQTTAVGSYAANNYGLYDMHGNVWEWCWDWFDDTYPVGISVDYTGPGSGSARVLRGGSWFNNGRAMRSAFRESAIPSYWYENVGFRVARSL